MYVDLESILSETALQELPTIVRDTLDHVELWIPDDPEQEENEVYNRAKRGHCMTCDGELKQLTMLCINQAGIVMIFCCGQCYTDMQVTGFLEEQYQDLVDAIKFRGGQVEADEPETE